MADTRPTPVSFFAACRLCVVLLVAPSKFKEIERSDQVARNHYNEQVEQRHRADIVRAAFLTSFWLVVGFSTLGFGLGKLMHVLGRCATPDTIAWAQVIGAGLLLWGTLFVRGWEIQSSSGVQFAERVNQWLYRTLYCIGTAVIVYPLSFPQCNP